MPCIVNEDGEIEEEGIFVKEDDGVRQRRRCYVIFEPKEVLLLREDIVNIIEASAALSLMEEN